MTPASTTAPAAIPSAFARLRTLLADAAPPPDRVPVDLHLGECRLGAPTPLLAPLADLDGWTRYPPLGGLPHLRAAYRGWLGRRFGVAAGDDPDDGDGLAVEPTPGTKQAVATLIALAVTEARDRSPDGGAPAVVLPNPGYPTYLAATAGVGARAVPYPVDGPDLVGAVASAVRAAAGAVAAVVVCHPGNPRGDVLDADALRAVAAEAAAAGALLVVDECYVDLGVDPGVDPGGDPSRPPVGYLAAAPLAPGPFAVLHSLSKRSAAPGLRSGFLAGDPATVARYAHHNRGCGVSVATPVCAAAAALWADDAHVERLRERLRRCWDTADVLLADVPGYRRPAAGFFLWLPLPGEADDEAVARRLWSEHAVSVMPGRYLATTDDAGTNPGAGHLRVALAHPPAVLRPALSALRATVMSAARSSARSSARSAARSAALSSGTPGGRR